MRRPSWVSVIRRLPAAAASRSVPAARAGSTAGTARGGRLGHFDLQRAAAEGMAVELSDRRLGRLGRRHLDEAEAARLARVPIGHDRDVLDALELAEELAQRFGRGADGKAADEKLRHELSS